jgi:predicted lipoprotein with Yx(FWY)xxD motif
MLVDGSPGASQGTALYTITSDYGSHIGCGTRIVTLFGGMKLACTGPAGASTTEWPALLTAGAPVAGPGVSKKLLGEVNIKGLGEQVTYNGHPLYLFDSIPGVLTGENWDEPDLPPWHGAWYLVNPAGSFLPRPAMLSTVTLKGHHELAAYMEAAGGFALFPVYSYSGGAGCTKICSDTWPPLISEGTPGRSAAVKGRFGSVRRADGTRQVTYNGKPLYLDGNEEITLTANGFTAEGNGNGAKAPAPYKGTFKLVAP